VKRWTIWFIVVKKLLGLVGFDFAFGRTNSGEVKFVLLIVEAVSTVPGKKL